MTETTITRLLTPQELADIIQVPVRTLEGWRATDRGPRAIRIGKHIRYRPADVEAWLDRAGAA